MNQDPPNAAIQLEQFEALEYDPHELKQIERVPAVWQAEALVLLRQLKSLTGHPMSIPLEGNGNDPELAIKNMRRTVEGLAAMPPRARKAFIKKLAKPRPKFAHKRR